MAPAHPMPSIEEMAAALESIGVTSPDDLGGYLARLAAQEEAEGNSARANEFRQQCSTLIGFTEYRMPKYQTAPHHRLVAEQLERVERREIDRLMLLMPPRHGKSELASKSYPAWCLGRQPWKQIISASASNDLAQDWGYAVRNIVECDEYRLVYPGTQLVEDRRAAGKWWTKSTSPRPWAPQSWVVALTSI